MVSYLFKSLQYDIIVGMKRRNASPLISVVITTRNEEGVIVNLLNSVERQTYRNLELILVDNNSTDKTKELATHFTKNVYNFGPERSSQRNYGVTRAKGEYILVLDADMKLTKKVVEECINLTKEEKAEAIIIPEKSYGQGFWTKFKVYEREFYEGEEDIEAARFFKRDLFKKFGGYDTSITGPEDWDLPLRMKKKGIKIGRIKSYILHNERTFSPWKSARKKFYYASHAFVYLKRHPEMITSQGNLLFRPVFFRKWRKLISNPYLSIGMFIVRSIEMVGAGLGMLYSIGKRWGS